MNGALLTLMDSSAVDAAIGERVHTLMWRGKVSQVELASELGIDQSALSRRLRGRTSWRATELLYIAERLHVTLEDLVPGREEVAVMLRNPPNAQVSTGVKGSAESRYIPTPHAREACGTVRRPHRRHSAPRPRPCPQNWGRTVDSRGSRWTRRPSVVRRTHAVVNVG